MPTRSKLFLRLALLAAALPALASAALAMEEGAAPQSLDALLAGANGAAACNVGTFEQMLPIVAECQGSAPFLANLGYELNVRGRYSEAIDHLERALMLDPGLKGAKIDFAVALARIGEDLAAQALIEDLLADPDLPPALAPQLRRERQRIFMARLGSAAGESVVPRAGELPQPDAQWRRTGSIRLGWDSNLLGAPNLTNLTLTLPEGALTLPLEGFKAQRGGYARADAGLEYTSHGDDGVVNEVSLNLQVKQSPSLRAANSQQYELFTERRLSAQQEDGVGHYGQLSVGGLQAGSGLNYRVARAAGGVEWFGLAGWQLNRNLCVTRIGLELQSRQIGNSPILSGRYAGLIGSFRCLEPGADYWQLVAQVGADKPRDGSRPGGRQTAFALRLAGLLSVRKWLPGFSRSMDGILLDIDIGATRDEAGYSPLLSSGASRRINRGSFRTEWQRPINNGVQMFAAIQWMIQRSNISLFQQRSWAPYLGVRVAW